MSVWRLGEGASRERRSLVRVAPACLSLLLLSLLAVGCKKQDPAAEAPPFGCEEAPLPTQVAAIAASPTARPPRVAATSTAEVESATATATATATEEGPALPPGALPIFDLPFPYDGSAEGFGGTVGQFMDASQRRRAGGRINSFFDHLLPLYGAESQAPGSTGSILIFDGVASPNDAYSGHPGYDFSVQDEANRRSTPVLAAAAGEITTAGWHDLMGWHVMLRHEVAEVGAFQTIYMHLQDDGFFGAMRDQVGSEVAAGARIGTMGTTGNSDGEHLHFEVRFDLNGDGRFTYGQETVDPFGFLPSVEYPGSPWLERQGLGAPRYLWRVPLQTAARVPADGGGDLPAPGGLGGAGGPDRGATAAARTTGGEPPRRAGDGGLCAPPGSLPPGGVVQLGWAPDPAPSEDLAGVGGSVVVSVVDAEGKPVDEIDPPLAVEVPFDPAKLEDVDADSLSIHRWEPDGAPAEDRSQLWERNPAVWGDTRPGSAPLRRPRGLAQADPLAAPGGRWRPLPTRVDLERGLAVAATDRPGRLALLGRPLRDLVAPTTRIVLEGPQGAQGAFFEEVTVTLIAEDPSGIARMRYRLGFEEDWQEYDGPFVLRHADIPADAPEGIDERFLRGAGRRLVVASAIDGAGNVEEPPASRAVVIDRRADPVYTPPPATATAVLSGTAQAVVTGTLTAPAPAEGAEGEPAGAAPAPAGSSTEGAGQGSTSAVTAPGSPAATAEAPPAAANLPRTATPAGARSGDSSAASRLAPGAATAAARGAIRLPTLVVAGPISPTPPPPSTRMPRADATATADVEARERAERQTATARARRAATATAVGAPRRSTAMVPDPVEPPPPPGGARVMVPTATPTPPALLAPVLTAPADGAGPACGAPVTLDWDGVAALRGRGSHRWSLERLVVGEDGVPRWQALDGGETVGALTSTTLLSPPCGARLRWRVRGVDSSGRLGEWSSWRLLSPLDAPPPAAPTQDATGGYPYP